MTSSPSLRPRSRPRSRFALALACTLAAQAAFAADRLVLRGDITATRDTVTIGDLVENAPSAIAGTALFRAPALGQSGTIQAKRIQTAVDELGFGTLETGGRLQVTITRATRHIGPAEIEAAIRKRLVSEFGADPTAIGIAFDGNAPELLVSPEITGAIAASDVTLDRRSRRLSANVWIGPSASERRAQMRVTGSAVDLVDVAVAVRPLERGQTLVAADLTIERRPRDLVPTDAVQDGSTLEGRVARRQLGIGALLRPADLVRPELVARGEVVTVIYATPGISLSMRAKANEAGTMGDTIGVVNPQSKKVLQAVIVGPGRVSVNATSPGRLAAAASTSSAGRPAGAASVP